MKNKVEAENPLSFLASIAKVNMKKKLRWKIFFLLIKLNENRWSFNSDIPLMSKILEYIHRIWDRTEEDLRQNRPWQGIFRKGTVTICRSGGKASYISQTPAAGKM